MNKSIIKECMLRLSIAKDILYDAHSDVYKESLDFWRESGDIIDKIAELREKMWDVVYETESIADKPTLDKKIVNKQSQ